MFKTSVRTWMAFEKGRQLTDKRFNTFKLKFSIRKFFSENIEGTQQSGNRMVQIFFANSQCAKSFP